MNTIELYIKDVEKLFEQELYEDAQRILENLLMEEPGCAKIHNHLGWLYLYQWEELERAELHLNYAIKFDSTYAPAYWHLACLYEMQEKYNKEIDVLKQALNAKNIDRSYIYHSIGQTYENLNEYNNAINAYREGLMTTTNNFAADSISKSIRRCRKKMWMNLFNRNKRSEA